jgi:SAM-dependent methyltransferase
MHMRGLERRLLSTRLRGRILRSVEVPRVLAGLDLPAGGRCLEIGSGNGEGALAIGRRLRPARLVCVDSDPRMVARAHRLHLSRAAAGEPGAADVETLCADATDLPLAAGSFDAALLFGALHHIRRWPAALAEVHRVLEPGGVFAFEEALLGRSPLLLNRFFRHVPFGPDELTAALTTAGFRIERFDTALLGHWCFVRARRARDASE